MWERLNDLMGKTGNWALDSTMGHLGPFGDAMGKSETLVMRKLEPLMSWWWENWGPRPGIIFKRFNMDPLHSFKLVGPKFQLRNFRWHASWKKKCIRPKFPIFRLIFQRSWFWYFLSSTQRHGDISSRAPVRVFEKFRFLFPFLFFFSSFSFLFFIFFFVSFLGPLYLGGPFSSGAPGHCPSMPPSRYATVKTKPNDKDGLNKDSKIWQNCVAKCDDLIQTQRKPKISEFPIEFVCMPI